MSMTTSATVQGRLFIVEEYGCVRVDLWHHSLVPMEYGKRPVEEWVAEHIRELDESTLRQGLQLPLSGNFQVLFKATIHGFTVLPYHEYDEELDFDDVAEYMPIPDDFLKYLDYIAEDE